MMKQQVLILMFIVLGSFDLSAQEKEKKPEPIWDVSFGTSQLFEGWFHKDTQGIIPTTSALLTNELFLTRKISLALAFNLPMVPSRRVIDGKISESYSAPANLVGPAIDLFHLSVSKRATFKVQVSLLMGTVIKPELPIFPLSAFRLKIESDEKSGVYIGVSASLAVNSIGLIYGVLYRF